VTLNLIFVLKFVMLGNSKKGSLNKKKLLLVPEDELLELM